MKKKWGEQEDFLMQLDKLPLITKTKRKRRMKMLKQKLSKRN